MDLIKRYTEYTELFGVKLFFGKSCPVHFLVIRLGRAIRYSVLHHFSSDKFLTSHDKLNFVLQKVLVRDLFCGEISNNVVSLVRQRLNSTC